jgi:hypothetical protein
MHEHWQNGITTRRPIQCQQREPIAQKYVHGHWHGCTVATLHKRWHDSPCRVQHQSPEAHLQETSILHFANTRSNVCESTQKIHPALIHILIALNGISIKLQPRYTVASAGMVFALACSCSAWSVSRAGGDGCGAAGGNGVIRCGSRH